MPRLLGTSLPPALQALFDGERLPDKVGTVIQCLTVDPDGWPKVSMVSVGELATGSDGGLRLAVWQRATTAQRLGARERCSLALVDDGVSYLLHCSVRWIADLDVPPGPPLTAFALTVVEVFDDVAEYATLTSGITYELHEPELVIARWQATVNRLRALPAS